MQDASQNSTDKLVGDQKSANTGNQLHKIQTDDVKKMKSNFSRDASEDESLSSLMLKENESDYALPQVQ